MSITTTSKHSQHNLQHNNNIMYNRQCKKINNLENVLLNTDILQRAQTRSKQSIRNNCISLPAITRPPNKKKKIQTLLINKNNIMDLNCKLRKNRCDDIKTLSIQPLMETQENEQHTSESGSDEDLVRDHSFQETMGEHLNDSNIRNDHCCSSGKCNQSSIRRKPPIPHQRTSSMDSNGSSDSNNGQNAVNTGHTNLVTNNNHNHNGSNINNNNQHNNGQSSDQNGNNNVNNRGRNNGEANNNRQNGSNSGGDDGKDEDGDEDMVGNGANGRPVNEYVCDKCKNVFLLNDDRHKSGLIKQFMKQWICQQCTYDIQHDSSIKVKKYTIFKCEHKSCRDFDKVWTGKNAEKNWKTHYNKYHPTSNPDFFKVTSQKLCEHQGCVNVIKNVYHFCKNHQNVQQRPARNMGQTHGDYSFIDGNGDLFDTRRIMHLFDVNEDFMGDEQKDNIAKHFVNGLKKFSHVHDDYGQGLEGVVDIRLIMAIYHHIPLRQHKEKHRKETMFRSELFKQKKYCQLMSRIMDEQKRRNDKKDRQYKNRQKAPEPPPVGDIFEEEECIQDEDEQKGEEDVHVNVSLNDGGIIRNEMSLPYNTNNIARNINDYKYADYETAKQIKERINRCCKLAKKGKWKKANDALDPGIVADLNKNNNWQKTLKKFPQRAPIVQDHRDITPKWRLTEEEVRTILKSINTKSVGGPCGINNALLKWIVERDDTYKIVKLFRLIAKMIVEKGLPRKIRDIIFFARGLPLAKEKNGIIDFDIRPVLITDSWLRMVDRIITCNEDPKLISEAVGEYQTADMRAGCEIASISMEYHQQMMDEIPDEALAQSDAINAYNNMDRQMSYNECKVAMPNTINWFSACYGGAITVKFDHHRELKMTNGFAQGFSSSNKFYMMGKKKVLKKTEKQMEQKHPNKFRINYQTDCSDDGAQSMHYSYIPEYMDLLINNYKEWNIGIHKDKTNIVLKTTNPLIIQYMRQHMSDFKLNFEGNMEYLSIPHGTKAFVNNYIFKHVKKLITKIKHIETIRDRQIRTTMYLKFMNLNKIIYILKNAPIYKEWLDKFGEIYDYIVNSITAHINVPEIAKYQIPLSQSKGGLGMRNPRIYYAASKISALNNTIDIIPRFFRFKKLHAGVVGLNDINKYNKAFANARRRQQHIFDKYLSELNNQITPDTLVVTEKTKHRHILQLIDNKYMRLFNENGTDYDRARIRSLTTAGATAWLFVPANGFYGQKYTNLEHYILLSLFLGAKMVQQRKICKRCGQEMDEFGYHCLSCPSGPLMIQRHNGLRNISLRFAKMAGFRVEIEQKYNREMAGLDLEDTDLDDPIHGVPGDIKIYDWYDDRDQDKDMYGDMVVGNIFAPSYISNTRKERLWLAKKKEKEKREKYGHPRNFIPMAMEVMGAMGVDFKRMLQQLADRIATRKNISYGRMMNRMRVQLTSYLMKKNAEMIMASLTL